jgi:ribulose-5-phosphate 4-epimerase/fuculose-1-phosphate aldolase
MPEEVKRNLAAAYRIIAKLDMDDHTYTHLSARPSGADFFYIYPFGLRFEEVTEDCLLKVNFQGELIEGSEYQYNKTGYIIHGGIYRARPDINAVFHLHTESTVAVSSLKDGLLPISQWALHFYDKVSYHDYNSLALDRNLHGQDLVRDLGDNYTMLLRNHGFITSGRTIHEAMFYTYHLEKAARTQIMALSCGQELIIPDKKVCERAVRDLLSFEQDLGIRDWQAWLRWVGHW